MNPPFLWGLTYTWRTLLYMNKKEEAVDVCKKVFLLAGMNDIIAAMDKAGIDYAFDTALTSDSFFDNPYPTYHQLRADAPVYWCEAWSAWVLTHYDDVMFVLQNYNLPWKGEDGFESELIDQQQLGPEEYTDIF